MRRKDYLKLRSHCYFVMPIVHYRKRPTPPTHPRIRPLLQQRQNQRVHLWRPALLYRGGHVDVTGINERHSIRVGGQIILVVLPVLVLFWRCHVILVADSIDAYNLCIFSCRNKTAWRPTRRQRDEVLAVVFV